MEIISTYTYLVYDAKYIWSIIRKNLRDLYIFPPYPDQLPPMQELPPVTLLWDLVELEDHERLTVYFQVGYKTIRLDFYNHPSNEAHLHDLHKRLYNGKVPNISDRFMFDGIVEALHTADSRGERFILECLGFPHDPASHAQQWYPLIQQYIDVDIYPYIRALNSIGCTTSGSCADLHSYPWIKLDTQVLRDRDIYPWIVTFQHVKFINWDKLVSHIHEWGLVMLKTGPLFPENPKRTEWYIIFSYPTEYLSDADDISCVTSARKERTDLL